MPKFTQQKEKLEINAANHLTKYMVQTKQPEVSSTTKAFKRMKQREKRDMNRPEVVSFWFSDAVGLMAIPGLRSFQEMTVLCHIFSHTCLFVYKSFELKLFFEFKVEQGFLNFI